MLMKPTMAIGKVCTVQPLGVSENATFFVDVEAVDLQDLKADDLGSWHPTEVALECIGISGLSL